MACSEESLRPKHARAKAAERLDNADQERPGAISQSWVYQAASPEQVQDGGAFGGAAARHSVEPGLVGGRHATSALGNVQDDRDARAIELVAKYRLVPARNESGGQRLELDREPVAVELFGVEQRLAGEEGRAIGGLCGAGGEVGGHRNLLCGPRWATLMTMGRPARLRRRTCPA